MPRKFWKCACGRKKSVLDSACKCGNYRWRSAFHDTVQFLFSNGYDVEIQQDEWIREGELAIFRGKGILGLIGCGPDGYPADGKIVADNDKCFNKWSQCPLRVRFPKNVDDRVKVLEYFDFLSSKCGRKWSAKFEYLDNPVLPREE